MRVSLLDRLWLFAAALVVMGSPQQAFAETPTPLPGSIFRDCPRCPEMIVIPAGNFMMGSSPEDAARDIEAAPSSDKSLVRMVVLTEQPQHEVTIKFSFAVAKYPVTKVEFAAFVEETGYAMAPGCILSALQYHVSPQADWRLPGFVQSDRDPAVCVNWHDAKAYVEWLNRKSSTTTNTASEGAYRLPSEAEWEYAARAGTHTARWWGDAIGQGNAVCARCGSKWDHEKTAPVGSFRPNPFGLHDLLGNVSQLTEDCWNENYVNASVDGSPRATGNCERRAGRGGNWINLPWVLRSATRSGFNREDRYNYVGFRVAKTLRPATP